MTALGIFSSRHILLGQKSWEETVWPKGGRLQGRQQEGSRKAGAFIGQKHLQMLPYPEALESGRPGSHPGSAPFLFCGLGQIIVSLCFLICKTETRFSLYTKCFSGIVNRLPVQSTWVKKANSRAPCQNRTALGSSDVSWELFRCTLKHESPVYWLFIKIK